VQSLHLIYWQLGRACVRSRTPEPIWYNISSAAEASCTALDHQTHGICLWLGGWASARIVRDYFGDWTAWEDN
jgi:hypothetical protein